MESPRLGQPLSRPHVTRLGVSLGLAVLFAALMVWASTGGQAMSPAVARPASNGAVITVGVAAAMSGPIPDYGWRQVNAVQLAIDQINAAGGIDVGGVTHTLTLVAADDGCSQAQAPTAANALLNAGAVAVVGHTCSSASFAAQGIYDAAGVAMVSASSTNPGLTEQGYTTTFRVCQKDDAAVILMATTFREALGYDAVALVAWDGFEWSTAAFSDTFTALGGSITSQQSVSATGSFTAMLTAIALENPDAVFYADGDPARAGTFSAIADSLGLAVVGWDSLYGDSALIAGYASAAGVAAERDYAGIAGRDPVDMPGYAGFNAAYQAAAFPNYGADGGAPGAFAYDAAQIIFDAIKRADSADPEDIRDALAATPQTDGVVGTYEGFDAKGDVIPQWAWLELFHNGQWLKLPSAAVGLVTDGPAVDDAAFAWMAYQGLLRAQMELGVAGTVYTSTSSADYGPNLQQCVDDGNDLCIGVGWAMTDATVAAAQANPATLFAIIDVAPDTYPPNLRGITFAADEVGYLAGTLAGLMTASDVVGDIGGMPIAPVDDFLYGYRNGAQCANPDATVLITYTMDFGDQAVGATYAQALIDQGADVIFAAAGGAGFGAVLTATQSGVWGIGVDIDYYDVVFGGGTVDGAEWLLSSALKRVDNAVFTTAGDVVSGTFAAGTVRYGLESGGVGLAPFHDADPFVSQSVRDALAAVKQGIIAGTIDISDPCSGFYAYLPLVMKGQ